MLVDDHPSTRLEKVVQPLDSMSSLRNATEDPKVDNCIKYAMGPHATIGKSGLFDCGDQSFWLSTACHDGMAFLPAKLI